MNDLPDHLPHDIYDVLAFPDTPFPWKMLFWVALGVLGTLVLFYLFRRRKKKNTPKLPPKEEAYRAIVTRPPDEPFSEYFFHLSQNLKKILGQEGRTTQEIENLSFSPEICLFLRRADGVKFAKSPTDLEEALGWQKKVADLAKPFLGEGV